MTQRQGGEAPGWRQLDSNAQAELAKRQGQEGRPLEEIVQELGNDADQVLGEIIEQMFEEGRIDGNGNLIALGLNLNSLEGTLGTRMDQERAVRLEVISQEAGRVQTPADIEAFLRRIIAEGLELTQEEYKEIVGSVNLERLLWADLRDLDRRVGALVGQDENLVAFQQEVQERMNGEARRRLIQELGDEAGGLQEVEQIITFIRQLITEFDCTRAEVQQVIDRINFAGLSQVELSQLNERLEVLVQEGIHVDSLQNEISQQLRGERLKQIQNEAGRVVTPVDIEGFIRNVINEGLNLTEEEYRDLAKRVNMERLRWAELNDLNRRLEMLVEEEPNVGGFIEIVQDRLETDAREELILGLETEAGEQRTVDAIINYLEQLLTEYSLSTEEFERIAAKINIDNYEIEELRELDARLEGIFERTRGVLELRDRVLTQEARSLSGVEEIIRFLRKVLEGNYDMRQKRLDRILGVIDLRGLKWGDLRALRDRLAQFST